MVAQQGFEQSIGNRYRQLHRLAHRQLADGDQLQPQHHHAATLLDIQDQPLIVQVKKLLERH
ncbi:hypothetical protein D3C86_1962460 [compost metagenome]